MTITKQQKQDLNNKALLCAKEIRKKFRIGQEPIEDISSLVLNKEFLLLRFPNDNKISGIYLEKKDRNTSYKCIYVNTLEPQGRQNFTIAHELYHAYYELSNDCYCLMDERNKDPIEYTAERFASYLLIPRQTLVDELKKRNINNRKWLREETVFELQEIFNVSFISIIVAINEFRNNEDLKMIIPKNIQALFKYRYEKYWDELTNKTNQYNCQNKLNTVNPQFEFPKNFRNNIQYNVENNNIDKEEIQDIVDFFE